MAYTKYTGGNAALDEILKKQGQVYAENREKALAGDERAITAMRNANDAANQARNAAGYAAEYANDDIEYVKANAKPKTTSKPATSAPSTMQNYIEDMYKAQRENALAQLKSAYESNLNAINRAGQGIGQQFTNARNQTAGASELSARNFQEYAAAMGLNSGAGGQAELSRNIALQNDLSALDAQEASTVADLELRKTQAESDYNNAVAQAQSQNDAEKAAAMYKEMVRQEEAALAQELRDLEIARTERSNLADFGTAFLKNGTMPSPEMLAAMGMTQEDAQRYLNALAASKVVPTTTTSSKQEEYKPTLKYDEVVAELLKGNRTPGLLKAAEHFLIDLSQFEEPAAPLIENETLNKLTTTANERGYETNDYLFDMAGITYDALEARIRKYIEEGDAIKANAELEKYEKLLNPGQTEKMKKLLSGYNLLG